MGLLQIEFQTDVFACATDLASRVGLQQHPIPTLDRDLLYERAPLRDPLAFSAVALLASKTSLGPREVVPAPEFFQHEDHL